METKRPNCFFKVDLLPYYKVECTYDLFSFAFYRERAPLSTFEPSLPCMARKLLPAEANNTTQQQCTRSTVSPCPLPCPLHSTTSLMPPSVI